MKVIVVGAGLAGFAAARDLLAAGCEVHVLEARERVGGRLEGGAFDDGTPIELGGQWIGPTQTRVADLVTELGLETFPTHTAGRVLVELGGRRTHMSAAPGAVPRLPPFVLADLAQGLARFERLSTGVDLTQPWASSSAERLDHETFESWIRRTLRTPTGRAYFRVATEAVFAAGAGDLSLLHAAFYARSGGGLAALLASEDGAQQDRIVGGSVQIAQRLADAVLRRGGDRVRLTLGSPVRGITQRDESVVVTTRDGRREEAGRVVVTLPPTLAGRLDYDPPMPSWRDQLTQRVPAGSVIKVHLRYPRPFWREQGWNGQVASDRGPVKVVFDNSPPSGTPGVLLAFLEGEDARRLARASEQERHAAVIARLVDYLGRQAAHPTQIIERDWSAEEFTRGCYGAHFTPGTWTSYGHALRAPVGRIHWAGAETSPVWNGYMEGALRSGERVAREITTPAASA
ncbi:MAG: flavin monoamine oxidase family protein [Mobilicoccus sp.]|nr:flavin monoamine oxidase family protein [Mobilicoccus sp.]